VTRARRSSFLRRSFAGPLAVASAVLLTGGCVSTPSERWLVPPASAVSLGDSYAVGQTGPLRDQLGVEVLDASKAGSFAAWWLDRPEEWIPAIRELPGPVLVVLSAGTNDEGPSAYRASSRVVAERVAALVAILLFQRPDLQVIVTGYNGSCADAGFPAYLPPDIDRYRYIETRQLDDRLGFRDACHPDEDGFAKRVRYLLSESRRAGRSRSSGP